MAFSALSFAIMASFVKATPYEASIKALSRQVISFLIIVLIINYKNIRIIPKRENRLKLISRCVFGTIGIYLYFISIDNLLLANASMLTRLSPFFVTIFSFIILKENVTKINWIIFIPMIIGCFLIIKPNSDLFNPISIVAVLSAISGAFAYTMIKSIGNTESGYTIIFWFTLLSSIFYTIIAIPELININPINNYINLLMIGVFGVLGQMCLTFSYQRTKANIVAPYSYLYILFSGISGYLIWNEFPDKLSILGYLFIIISYLFLLGYNHKIKKLY